MGKSRFLPHEIEWDNKKITEFWDYVYSVNDPNKGFAEINGKKLIQIISNIIQIQGNILDYSAGFGYMLKYLMNKSENLICYCTECSIESVIKLNEKFKTNSRFKEAKLVNDNHIPWSNDFFDIIFITEVIEHIPLVDLEALLKEFSRVLKVNGKLVITVPNNENLDAKKQLCPECGAIFHPVQHINSFNFNSLNQLISNFNFKLFFKKELYFNSDSVNLKQLIKKIYYSIYTQNKPNLIFIAEKT